MGKLARLANTRALAGAVTLTCLDTGASQTFDSEQAAEAALPTGAKAEHRRGAFFYQKPTLSAGTATSGGSLETKPKRKRKAEGKAEASGD